MNEFSALAIIIAGLVVKIVFLELRVRRLEKKAEREPTSDRRR